MPSKVTPEALAKKVQSQKDRFERLEREVRALKDILNVHDNWNAEIREWIGKEVRLHPTGSVESCGVLKWSDRYNLCVVINGKPRIYNKGGLAWIEPV